ncbi:hypothetical protein OFEAOIEE_LOCUS4916 [Methylorubrum extorquens]
MPSPDDPAAAFARVCQRDRPGKVIGCKTGDRRNGGLSPADPYDAGPRVAGSVPRYRTQVDEKVLHAPGAVAISRSTSAGSST